MVQFVKAAHPAFHLLGLVDDLRLELRYRGLVLCGVTLGRSNALGPGVVKL